MRLPNRLWVQVFQKRLHLISCRPPSGKWFCFRTRTCCYSCCHIRSPPNLLFRFSRTHRTGKENNMIKINLRHYYPHYTSDVFIEVPDAIAIELHAFEKQDAAFHLRSYRNHAYFSLDHEDNLEREMLFVSPSSEDCFFREHIACSLFSALRELPVAQARRVYSHYILGMSFATIASVESINEGNVRKSVARGLRRLQKILGEFHD